MAQFEEFPSPTSRIEVCLDELAAHLGKAALRLVMNGIWYVYVIAVTPNELNAS